MTVILVMLVVGVFLWIASVIIKVAEIVVGTPQSPPFHYPPRPPLPFKEMSLDDLKDSLRLKGNRRYRKKRKTFVNFNGEGCFRVSKRRKKR
jgi:hypothetical protein